MKLFRLTVVMLFVLGVCSLASADNEPLSRWGNLIDVAYKFSWYPKKDLQDLLEKKSEEYGKSLDEYCKILKEELTHGATDAGLLAPDSFVEGKDWKAYYRLAVGQFCLFLSNDNETHLKNAQTSLSILSGKMELSNIAFWNYLFQAYSDLNSKDKDAFVTSVFHLWQNVILRLESDDILMMGSKGAKSELVKNLGFLYENLAHLVITRAIIEDRMPDLQPLGVIILSLKDKLDNENGYKNIVESLVERMHGLKSDNSNLNFAVAFMEATANQYEFEDEKSASQVGAKYNSTCEYYDLALSWSHTKKGQAAILTQYMGFSSYVLRRLIDKDKALSQNALFDALPRKSNMLLQQAFSLYDQLAFPEVQNRGFIGEGFEKKNNYIVAMQHLWDSSAKLLIMKSAYYKALRDPDKPGGLNVAESPLLKYLSFFEKYVAKDSDIVPDNAFFLAAYSLKELADLYRNASKFSTRIEVNNLAFDYQLRAIELFPMDVTGILQLALQANQEGRLNRYLEEASPVALRFRNSSVAGFWTSSHSTDYENCAAAVKDVIPDLMDNACFLVSFLQQSGVEDSEDAIYQKAIVMTRLLMALKADHSEEAIEGALTAIAKQSFEGREVNEILTASLPKDLVDDAKTVPRIGLSYDFSGLKNALFGSIDNAIHSYLRELYYEGVNK